MSTELIQLNIPLNFDQLLGLVNQLSPKEKIKLESMIWNETDEENIEISAVQQKIVYERLQRMNNNPTDCKSWEEIESRLNL
jgi:Putative addiction module component.